MSAPRIRITEGATEFERELLEAWGDEAPPAGAGRKALALAGAGAIAGATSAGSAAGAAAGVTAVAGGIARVGAPKVAVLGGLALAKWIAAGSVVVAGAISLGPYLRTPAAIPRVESTSVETTRVTPREGSQPAPAAVEPVAGRGAPPAPVLDSPPEPVAIPGPPGGRESRALRTPAPGAGLTAAPVRAPAPARTPEVPVIAAPSASGEAIEPRHPSRGLGDQVALIDRARRAVAAGDPAEALRALDDYDGRFASGSLAQEAIVLRIQALLGQGDRAAAADLGGRFLAAHPASPHAARIQRLLAPAGSP